MSVIPSDIRFYHSSNGDLGGPIDTEEVESAKLHELFPAITGSQAAAGLTDYRCLYIRNHNQNDILENIQVYLTSQPQSPDVTIELALGHSPANTPEQSIPDGETAPHDVTFMAADSIQGAVTAGDLGPNGEYIAIWIKRTVDAGADAIQADRFSIAVLGETV